MKKILSINIIILIILSLIPLNLYAKNLKDKEKYFIVTAYYSPLPNQKHYITWNYLSEKILNWEGIRWASWKNVFSWMLAAPSKYKFWTKIYLEWLWVWSIEDRWWAIVEAGKRWYEHDRIDLWVWYWDEWLRRALYWGKRKIKWKIISSNSNISINYKQIPSPIWVTKKYDSNFDVFKKSLWKNSNKEDIKKLQLFFKEIWLYNWNIDWIYNNKIIDIVFNLQIQNNIIKNEYDFWAGYWGQQTRKTIKYIYENWWFEIKTENIKENIKNNKLDIFNSPLQWIENTKEIQSILKELWLYNWDINWVYSSIRDIILKYQIKNNIIKDKYEIWAWYFWPKTRKQLKDDYIAYIEKEEKILILQEKIDKIEKESLKKAEDIINKLWTPKYWEISTNVRALQLLLKDLWYFKYKDTAIFWVKTRNSIIKFQIENGIITSENVIWAGVVWPKTKKWLIKKIKENLTQKEIKQKWLDIELDKLTKNKYFSNNNDISSIDYKIIKI